MISLIVPWRHTTDRARILNYLWPAWEAEGYEVIVMDDDPSSAGAPWCKGKAWRRGLEKSTGDLVCLMDADCWVPHLAEAADLIPNEGQWAQGQNMVVRLDKAATEDVLSGRMSVEEAAKDSKRWEEEARLASAGVGTMLPRAIAEEIPLDGRFRGWGWEDNAWYEALTTVHGMPARLSNSLCFHLWHSPQPTKDRLPTSKNPNWLLYRQYVRARGKPSRMAEVISACWAEASSDYESAASTDAGQSD